MAVTADADLEALVDTGAGRGRSVAAAPLPRHAARACRRPQLIRFVVDPDGKVLPDIDGTAAGPWLLGAGRARGAGAGAAAATCSPRRRSSRCSVPDGSAGRWSSRCCAAAALDLSAWRAAPAPPSPASRKCARLAASGPRRRCCWRRPTAPPTAAAKLRRAGRRSCRWCDLFTVGGAGPGPGSRACRCTPRWRPAGSPTEITAEVDATSKGVPATRMR